MRNKNESIFKVKKVDQNKFIPGIDNSPKEKQTEIYNELIKNA